MAWPCVQISLLTAAPSTLRCRFTIAICSRTHRELGQLWVLALLVLLIALNDPLYIARISVGGNHALYVASVRNFPYLCPSDRLTLGTLRPSRSLDRSSSRGASSSSGSCTPTA